MAVKRAEIAVRVPVGREAIDGNLNVPEGARGLVVFAHGSGSSRFSPRPVTRLLRLGYFGPPSARDDRTDHVGPLGQPGALETVARLARDWFERTLQPRDAGEVRR